MSTYNDTVSLGSAFRDQSFLRLVFIIIWIAFSEGCSVLHQRPSGRWATTAAMGSQFSISDVYFLFAPALLQEQFLWPVNTFWHYL